MGAILRREFSSFFKSPIGYVFLAAFWLVAGWYYFLMFASASTQLSIVFYFLFFASVVLLPILTMKLFSEDKKQKTDQVLLTAPISLTSLVYGKFFAALFIYGIGVSITLLFALIVAAFQSPDWMVFFGNFLGLLLLGASLISVGLLISSLTESQIVAVILTLGVSLFLLLIDSFASMINNTFIIGLVSSISITQRYTEFTNGMLDISNVLFFLSIIVVMNFLTVRILEKRRWS